MQRAGAGEHLAHLSGSERCGGGWRGLLCPHLRIEMWGTRTRGGSGQRRIGHDLYAEDGVDGNLDVVGFGGCGQAGGGNEVEPDAVAHGFLAGAVEFRAVAQGDVLGGADRRTRGGKDCQHGQTGAEERTQLHRRFKNHPTTAERWMDRAIGATLGRSRKTQCSGRPRCWGASQVFRT